MATKYYGSLIMKTPVVNASQGDYTSVNDSAQQQYPVGGIYLYTDSNGCPRVIKYVRYNPTAAATYYQGSMFYYMDKTRSVVTNHEPEAATYISGKMNSIYSWGGVFLNATTPTAGNYCFVQTAGYNDKIRMPASTAAGNILVLVATDTNPTDNTFVLNADPGADALVAVLYIYNVVVVTAAASGGGLGGGWLNTPGAIL